MAIRTRTRVDESLTGTFSGGGSPLSTRTRQNFSTCEDEVKVGDNGSFTKTTYQAKGGVVNGSWSGGAFYTTVNYNHYPLSDPSSAPWWGVASGWSSPNDTYYANELYSKTNPSRADIDIPVFVAELKDIPHLFKIVGDTAIKTIAKANLSYWFGWKLLLQDLNSMLNFSDTAEKRYQELKTFYSSGLSCTRHLDNISHVENVSGHYLRASGRLLWRGDYRKVTTQEVWGHVKYFPTTLPPKTDAEMRALARRAALGLTIDPLTAWNLIPFSWLVDWFSGIGGYVSTYRNIVPSIHKDMCIMRRTNTTSTFTTTMCKKEWVSGDFNALQYVDTPNPVFSWESKQRRPANPGITLANNLPYLTGRQWSILGSLYVLRNRNVIRSGGLNRLPRQ